jgi:hypothetical protein
MFCHEDSQAVSRVVDFFMTYNELKDSVAIPLVILWKGLKMEHISTVLPLFKPEYLGHARNILYIENIQQYSLFKQMLSNDIYEDRKVYGTVAFSEDFVLSIPENESKEIIDGILNHYEELLKMHINDPAVKFKEYNEALFSTFKSVIGEEGRIAEIMYRHLCEKKGIRFFGILDCFRKYLDTEHFLKFLDSKLFSEYESPTDENFKNFTGTDKGGYPVCDEKVRQHYELLRRQMVCHYLYEEGWSTFSSVQRRAVMRFASVSGDEILIGQVYQVLASRFPIDARSLEDKLADCMLSSGDIIWEYVSLFTLRNRKKFLDQYELYVSKYIQEVFTKYRNQDESWLKEFESVPAIFRCRLGRDLRSIVDW